MQRSDEEKMDEDMGWTRREGMITGCNKRIRGCE